MDHCLGCVHTDIWTATCYRVGPDGSNDPYFGLPLGLHAECCGGHVLWAYAGP